MKERTCSDARYPALYQVNTRVWLTELSRALGKRASLDDISDTELDRLARSGFDWVWLLSVWQTGPAAQAISRANPGWRREFARDAAGLEGRGHRRLRVRHHGVTAHMLTSAVVPYLREFASNCNSVA